MIGIYRFKNKITGQVYIGQSVQLEARYLEHKRDSQKSSKPTKFYKAIQEYGWDNFEYSIIEECSAEELNDREIYWVSYYDSYHNGYNSTPGGQAPLVDRQLIYEAWDEGLSIKEISEKLKIGHTTIQNTLQGYNTYSVSESKRRGGKLAYKTTVRNSEEPKIHRYSLNGEYLDSWESTKQIQRELKIDSSSVGKVLNGKRNSAGGFLWSYELKNLIEPLNKNKTSIPKQVVQLSLNDEVVKEFSSLAEAAKAVSGDNRLISRVCNGKGQTAYGYKWKFKE